MAHHNFTFVLRTSFLKGLRMQTAKPKKSEICTITYWNSLCVNAIYISGPHRKVNNLSQSSSIYSHSYWFVDNWCMVHPSNYEGGWGISASLSGLHISQILGLRIKKILSLPKLPPLQAWKIFISHYYTQSNGWIEHVDNFLKTYIRGLVPCKIAWIKVAHIAFFPIIFFPNERSKESAFFQFLEELYMCNYWTQILHKLVDNIVCCLWILGECIYRC